YNNGDKSIPMNGVMSLVTDRPQPAFSQTKKPADEWNDMDTLMVSPVLNRADTPDPSGDSSANLAINGICMSIGAFGRRATTLRPRSESAVRRASPRPNDGTWTANRLTSSTSGTLPTRCTPEGAMPAPLESPKDWAL